MWPIFCPICAIHWCNTIKYSFPHTTFELRRPYYYQLRYSYLWGASEKGGRWSCSHQTRKRCSIIQIRSIMRFECSNTHQPTHCHIDASSLNSHQTVGFVGNCLMRLRPSNPISKVPHPSQPPLGAHSAGCVSGACDYLGCVWCGFESRTLWLTTIRAPFEIPTIARTHMSHEYPRLIHIAQANLSRHQQLSN